MEKFLIEHGHYIFGVVILLGGSWGLKFFDLFKKTVHNYLFFASIFALVFIALEVIAGTFKMGKVIDYLLTYTVVTTLYSHFLKRFLKMLFPDENKDA